ncbi:MAG: NlpC/P60 family protein [Bacteroidetes bacterium]|nr:MAG: NlpC/P60 family protein [Bacteroidota bacterium]
MRYFIVSVFIAILSFFRLPVKAAKKTMTKFGHTAIILKNYTDSLSYQVDTVARQFVDYAKTLIGTPYVWGSVNPKVGVDCSGFVNYVSHHFGISVPRTSAQFTHLGIDVKPEGAMPGDLILFTGSNAKKKVVGHMGIVTEEDPDGHVSFIHSSSGHKRGVHISELRGYYKTHLVKIIRIFPLAPSMVLG